jgi:hypothetical protein
LGIGKLFPGILNFFGEGKKMKKWIAAVFGVLISLSFYTTGVWAQEANKAQKRILMERGEKVMGARLELVRKVIESYQDCEVLTKSNELSGLRINGKLYQDFTLIIRDAKRTIIVVTADGVISFDY